MAGTTWLAWLNGVAYGNYTAAPGDVTAHASLFRPVLHPEQGASKLQTLQKLGKISPCLGYSRPIRYQSGDGSSPYGQADAHVSAISRRRTAVPVKELIPSFRTHFASALGIPRGGG
ncbi:uncharacterized protein BO72DRAFT_58131 [Aspergillus fijiensis CBS 313.89]|uniref:Uncharacterized protein n=1 Tax=Aspergillus fijiensis CBS 313.89 TaxID=1448319 RepID=A0A8G1RU78_9EURO|nr:uncharacterized protein BO72DRAFT_58131 [Aspergillus fijiensis CBS 313.89]RAK78807.1 hypothetical protein BO72DRAFT_58131 [Aspergillus fijiensis CBS 313.89]